MKIKRAKKNDDTLLKRDMKILPAITVATALDISIEKLDEYRKAKLLKPRMTRDNSYYSLDDFDIAKGLVRNLANV